MFGLNPFTRNYENILRALPKRERDYFTIFEKSNSEEERQRILELVPENERALYIARWKLNNADEIRRAQKAGILGNQELEEANTSLSEFYEAAEGEGLPTSKELFAEYVATRQEGESYPEWYRRTKLLSQYNLPKADWVGWHPSVDLEDIKLKVVQTLGEDMHDYDLWESRDKTMGYKPYLGDDTVDPIVNQESLNKEQMRSRIDDILHGEGIQASIFTTGIRTLTGKDQIDISVERDRSEELNQALNKMA